MPDPKKYDSEDSWMSACVPRMVDEGKPQKQAVAACLNMWRNKEAGMDDKAVWTTAYVNNLPDSAFLYVESGDKDGEGKTVPRTKRHFPYKDSGGKVDLPHLRNAIARIPQSNAPGLTPEKKKRLQERARKLLAGQQKSVLDKTVDWLKEAFGLVEEEKEKNSFTLWKDTDTGVYRWIAVYSNKWRDQDNPPEILASTAHKEFVDAVDKGDWPYPELWLWHIGGSRFGVADFVAYDDVGFAMASGVVDKDKSYIAESLAEQEDLAVSHGMPVKEIERDTEDPTIITRYRTSEISPLPREAAANKYGTSYEILREVKMAIPDEKRPRLEGMLGADGLARFEANLADKAKQLEELDIEQKAVDDEVAQEEVEEVEVVAEDAEPKEETPAEPAPEYVTADQVAEAVGAYLKPVLEQIQAFSGLSEAVEELGKEIKALKRDDEEKVKEALANTPAASLYDRIGSVIGSDDTYIDGRYKLAKAGPEEVQDSDNGPSKVGLINELFSQSWGSR